MKTVAQNRRVRYDYDITDTVEAGIMLTGQEVKSCRQGNVSLAGAYVSFLGDAPVLKSAKIAAYAYASGLESYDPGQDRRLLLKKADSARLQSAVDEKGVSVLPLEVRAGRHIKVLLGLGRGRKRHDKRQRKKDREVEKRLRKGEEY
jgi:SsrA-binding protein